MEERQPTRREVIASILAAGATTSLSGCSEQKPYPTEKPMPNRAIRQIRDLANVQGIHYVNAAGEKVSLDTLHTQIGNNYSTVSFMFAACGDVCPMTATVLNKVSKVNRELKHIVISVDPAGDFSGALAEKLKGQGLILDGPMQNTTVLYPSTAVPPTELSLLEAGIRAQEIQNNFELITRGDKKEGHSGVITLFNPQGARLAQVMNPGLEGGIGKMTDELKANLSRAPSSQR